jgi:hypothetical protein
MFGRKPMESSTSLGGKEPKQSKSFRVDFAQRTNDPSGPGSQDFEEFSEESPLAADIGPV